jgi:hypothetical protein
MGGLQVRRVLTATPLARQHERRVAGRPQRRPKEIPWAAFDRGKYPSSALSLACDAQTKLALGEYGAVDLFSHLASAMALNGVPFDLVAEATRVPADEIRHADIALRMAGLFGGRDVTITIDRQGLRKRWRNDVAMEDLDVLVVDVAAIGETLACALLTACFERATDPTVRALLGTIVADEVHHARLGWYYLAWRSPQWTRAERQRVADRIGELVVSIERRFWRGRDAPASGRSAARALGVLESVGQRAAVRAVMEDEIVPALDAIGLGMSHAWRIRQRGSARG